MIRSDFQEGEKEGGASSLTTKTDFDYRLVCLKKPGYCISYYSAQHPLLLLFSYRICTVLFSSFCNWLGNSAARTYSFFNCIPLYFLSHLFHFATGEALNYHHHWLPITVMYYSNSTLRITLYVFFMPEVRPKTQFSPQLDNEIVFFQLTLGWARCLYVSVCVCVMCVCVCVCVYTSKGCGSLRWLLRSISIWGIQSGTS